MPNEYEIIAFGRTAEILSYGDQQVLKLFRPGMPEHLVESEFNITQNVFRQGISCPEPIEIIDYADRKGIIYSRLDGKTMLTSIVQNSSEVNEEAARMARIHCMIHGKSVSNLPKQKDILFERIEHAPILSSEEKKQIIRKLNALPESNRVCHGDFHPDNIILEENKEWIIDWMTGMQGNPAGDVARTILMLKLGTLPEEIPSHLITLFADIRNQLLTTYTNEYLMNSDITIEEIHQWMVPIAAARLNEWIPEQEKNELVKLIREYGVD